MDTKIYHDISECPGHETLEEITKGCIKVPIVSEPCKHQWKKTGEYRAFWRVGILQQCENCGLITKLEL